MSATLKLNNRKNLQDKHRLYLLQPPYNEWIERALLNREAGLVNEDFFSVLIEMSLWKREWDRKVSYERFKRFFDILFSLVSVVLLTPVLIICGIAIKLDSKGPIFFRQLRTGKFGQPFWILKFRTMPEDARKRVIVLKPLQKPKESGSSTRVGKILRDHKLDELPQLWNCLAGDMSIVGPRPLSINDSCVTDKKYYLRYAVKPGLTGLWQATVSNDADASKKLTLDTVYVKRRAFRLDLYLILRTFLVVFYGENSFKEK